VHREAAQARRIDRTTLRDHIGLARPGLADHALTAVNPIAINTKTPLRADACRNRERIIASARELFALRGEQAHMGHIAKHAGVGKGTLYRHVPDKEALLIEMLQAGLEDLYEIACCTEEIGDPFESVETALRTTLVAIEGNAGLQFAMMRASDLHCEGSRNRRPRSAATITGIVRRAQTAGSVRSDLNFDDIPMILIGIISTIYFKPSATDWDRHLQLIQLQIGYSALNSRAVTVQPGTRWWVSPIVSTPRGRPSRRSRSRAG
jgi:AcrR family transcriptional regulator